MASWLQRFRDWLKFRSLCGNSMNIIKIDWQVKLAKERRSGSRPDSLGLVWSEQDNIRRVQNNDDLWVGHGQLQAYIYPLVCNFAARWLHRCGVYTKKRAYTLKNCVHLYILDRAAVVIIIETCFLYSCTERRSGRHASLLQSCVYWNRNPDN